MHCGAEENKHPWRNDYPQFCKLTRHRAAARGAAPTGLDTVLHIADALTILCTFSADFRTFAADVFVMRRVQKHEVSSRAADLRARHHEPEVFRFDVLTASLQTIRHGRSETHLVAAQAFVDAGLHVFAHMFHRTLLTIFTALRWMKKVRNH